MFMDTNSKIAELKCNCFDIVETIKRHKQVMGQLDQKYGQLLGEIIKLQQQAPKVMPKPVKVIPQPVKQVKSSKKNGSK